ncbi:MAG: tRNA 4-thiouridine(8) synthase ThiI [Dissulfuribacterales bacterium]
MVHKKKVKGLGLCSGGLDSILSALVLREQGIDVSWIAFKTPFFSADNSRKASINNGIPLIVKNITDRYMPMLRNPPCGYGKHMNPCMDCHALMFRIAGEMMAKTESDFLFSGEVMGQRPMSQNKNSLRYVEKNSGYDGYILRPLSAKVLPETPMELNGLVDREKLCGFSGRSRKPQIALAQQFGVVDYPSPAGGCLLTDGGYSKRLKDLFDHQGKWSVPELNLLKHGRHLRLDKNVKIVVGRNKKDNENMLRYYRPDKDILIKTKDIPGPVTLIPNGCGDDAVVRVASITAGYSKATKDEPVTVFVTQPDGRKEIAVTPIPNTEVQDLLIP